MYNSPFGIALAVGGLVLCGAGGLLGWYYGFSPMWQSHGWEEHVTETDQHYVVSTQQGFALAGLQNTDGVVSGEYRPFLWCTHDTRSLFVLCLAQEI